jgi:voltage-gated sodium channel
MPRFAGAAANTVVQQHHNKNDELDGEDIQKANLQKAMEKEMRDRQEEADKKANRKLPYQNDIKLFYDKKSIQIFVAMLILLNFLISAINSQLLPEKGRDDIALFIFEAFEWFFGYAFLIELVVNFYGSYFWEFWKSAWNIFDFIIVVISLLSLYMSNLPGISVLRLFRAFRVVRLFKRIKTMRKMMDSIMKSLPGMFIAFSALGLIMGIYAIIGVNFWMDTFPEEFGTFLKALLSLLQIMTFDSWCSGIARKIIFSGGVVEAIYFISYVFIASIVMANVLIALLLDEFMNTSQQVDNEPEQDVKLALDKALAKKHDELAKEVFENPQHVGLNAMSMLQTKDFDQKKTRKNSESACAVYPDIQGDIEMQDIAYVEQRRKNAKETTQEDTVPDYAAHDNSVNTTDSREQNNRVDSEWRAKVDQNIKSLTRSLDTFHTKFEQLHGKLDQLDIRLSGFFSLALEAQKEKPAGGTK